MSIASSARRTSRTASSKATPAAAIRQLAARYALAVDSRDLDALVELFVPDVDCGRWGTGRPALRSFFASVLERFHRSVHLVAGHVIDLRGAEASGVVYCRAEH